MLASPMRKRLRRPFLLRKMLLLLLARKPLLSLPPMARTSATEDLVITQSGATEVPSISVSTDSDISGVLSASSGTITATITLSGSATGFQVSKSGDADDSFIRAFTSNVGDRTDNTLTIEYSRNTRFNERSADLIFRTTGGRGAATTQTLSLRQALSVSLDAVSHEAGRHTETFVSALAPLGATAFSAAIATNPDNFLSVVTPTGDLTSGSPVLTYSVLANTGAEREGEVEITYTDADDEVLTLISVFITQSAQILVATTNADGDAVDVSNLPAEMRGDYRNNYAGGNGYGLDGSNNGYECV